MEKVIRIVIIKLFFILLLLQYNIYTQIPVCQISGKILIGGENRWDYLSIDKTNNRLFVSHASKVSVIDLKNNSIISEMSGLNGVHGIEFAPEFNKGFITCGRDSTVRCFDLKTLKQTAIIKIDGKNPDAIIYDPFTKRVFAFNHSSGNVTAIDAKTGEIINNLVLNGTLEFAATDLKGKMFVNLEDKNAVVVFDPKELKEIKRWDIAPCESPSGMAIDRKNNRVFVAGDNQTLVVLDLNSGKVIKSLPIGKGVDGCAFDPETNLIFTSNGGTGTITIIKEETPSKFEVIANIKTTKGARTITLDESTHKIYTSAMLDNSNTGKQDFGVLVLDYMNK